MSRLLRTAAILGALSLPAIVDARAVGRAADLWRLAAGPHPHFASASAVLICSWAALVAVSGCVLLLAPGLLAVQALRAADNAGDWVLRAFVFSLLQLGIGVTVIQGLVGELPRAVFVALVLGWCAVTVTAGKLSGRVDAQLPMAAGDRSLLLSMLIAPAVIAIALAPKFFWESLNSDGAHAFEAARRLIYSVNPFFPSDAGGVSSYPGFKTVLSSYPMSWLLRLFGENEPALRFTFLLVLVLIAGGIAAATRRNRSASVFEPWIVWLGLAVFTVVMAYSASYETYHSDVALPGIADGLTIATALGMIGATVNRRAGWMAVFAALLYMTTPAGAPLAAFWFVAMLLALRPLRVREAVTLVAVMAGCVALERALPLAMQALGLAGPGYEHGTGQLATRLLSVQWRDWHRVLYFVIPAGILPGLAILAVWKQDDVGRAVALLTAATFGFFYVQDRFALHYFAPIWVLPLVVWWRLAPSAEPGSSRAPVFQVATVAAAMAAIAISLPPEPRPWIATREVGESIEDRADGYREGAPNAFLRSELLNTLFPTPANEKVPEQSYGGSHLSWSYYAQRRDRSRLPAYVLLPPEAAAPPGAIHIKSNAAGSLFVLDSATYVRHQHIPPGAGGIARVYRIAKYTLFYR